MADMSSEIPSITTDSDANFVTAAFSAFTTVTEEATKVFGAGDGNKAGVSAGEDKHMGDHMHFAASAIIGPMLCFPGLVGNILAIITWGRPGMRSSTGRYLTGQAVADIGVLLMFLFIDSLQHWEPEVKYNIGYGVFFCYFGYPLFFFSIVCSIWFTVGVTVDRYIMVCWITKAKRYCNNKRANFGLLIIAVNAFIINLPHFASYTPVYPTDTDTNQSANAKRVPTFKPTEFTTGTGGQFYEFWIHCIILILIPWVSVLLMNVMIMRKVTESNKKMADKKTSASATKSKQSENQITRLLLTVTFTFLFFIGVQCVVQCIWMQKPPGANWIIVDSAFALAKLGVVLNSSTNFLLYCMTGKRFRAELLKMMGFSEKEGQLSSLMDNTSSFTNGTNSTTSTTGI